MCVLYSHITVLWWVWVCVCALPMEQQYDWRPDHETSTTTSQHKLYTEQRLFPRWRTATVDHLICPSPSISGDHYHLFLLGCTITSSLEPWPPCWLLTIYFTLASILSAFGPFSLSPCFSSSPSGFSPSYLSIPPSISLLLFLCVPLCVVSDGCFSWQVKRHDGGLVPVTLHIFLSFSLFLFPSLLWRSIIGPWLCVLSSL